MFFPDPAHPVPAGVPLDQRPRQQRRVLLLAPRVGEARHLRHGQPADGERAHVLPERSAKKLFQRE